MTPIARIAIPAATLTLGITALLAVTLAQAPAQDEAPDMGDRLIAGLKQTEGCLGVDSGRWKSGKTTIVAWFEDKQAVVDWYNSPTHTNMMRTMASAYDDGQPLEHIDADTKPIMVMATLTFADRPHFEGLHLPVSQISIEMFQPLPGGAYLGKRLAPDTFKVDHMRNLTPGANGKSAMGE